MDLFGGVTKAREVHSPLMLQKVCRATKSNAMDFHTAIPVAVSVFTGSFAQNDFFFFKYRP